MLFMSIDLNVDHYTNKDLEILFTLTEIYNASQVERAENIMYSKLMEQVDISMKADITLFLKYAKERLISSIPIVRILLDSYQKTIKHDIVYSFKEPKIIQHYSLSFIDIPVYYPMVKQCIFHYNQEKVYIPDGTYTPQEMTELLLDLVYFQVYIKTYTLFFSKESFTIEFQKKSERIFGFQQLKYTSELNVVTGLYEIKSESPYGKETECLWIDVYDYHETFTTNITYDSPTIMACIPVEYGEHIRQKGEIVRSFANPVKIERLRIRLYDKYGEPFLLKSDYSLTLEIK
jgi:hypothetical protein